MAEAQYAQTQGVILLQKVVSAMGPIFTITEAQAHAEALGITPAQVRWILSQLAHGDWIALSWPNILIRWDFGHAGHKIAPH